VLNQLRPGRVAPTNHPERSPFSADEWSRPLRLLIDDDEVEGDASLELLRAMATRPSVEVYSTQGSTLYEARVEQLNASDPGSWAAVLRRGEDFDRCFVNDPVLWQDVARESGVESAEAIEALCRRLAIVDYWGSEDCDTIVTGGKLLSALRGAGGAPLKSPETALAELGLCLRAHGDYVVVDEPGMTVSMSSSFHVAAAVGLLPSHASWRAAAMSAWIRGEGSDAYVLIRSSVERLGRALRALDYVRVRRRHPQLEESWGELLFFFDTLLLMLDGALDCLARFFHHVLDLPGDAFYASWDKKKWLKELGRHEQRLADSPGRARLVDTCTAIAKLRNSIHGAVLSSELHEWEEDSAVTSDYGAGKLLIVGPDAAVLEGACRRLGLDGLIEPRTDTEVRPAGLIDADRFACAISREVLSSLEWLLSSADLSRLPEPPAQLDLDLELAPAEYRRNAALLAAIPPFGDDFSDALDIGLASRVYRRRH
jgi:hypothetical protein